VVVASGSAELSPGRATTVGTRSAPIRGLDGLRALAILGVLGYHLMPAMIPGGYLGVDVFFVLSGFLITSGLAATWAKHGGIDLPRFFQRRFNRIVPSMVVVLLTCTTIALAVGGDLLVGVDKQIYGAVSFTSNWFTIFAGGDYFAATTPALFGNLWYLALNVQFYLLWPPVLVLLLKRVRPEHLWAWAAGLGVISAGLMVGFSFTTVSQTRLYEGTDTHLFSLMFGSALALAYAFNQGFIARWRSRVSLLLAGRAGWLAGCALLVMFLTVQWESLASFRGLMIFAALLSVGVLAALVSYPELGTMLERQPIQWLGKHSYGIYLWHWPLLVILAAIFGQLYSSPPWWLVALVLLASVILTLGTEKLVNAPVASLGLRGYLVKLWRLPRLARIGIAAVAASGLVATGAAAATAPAESEITRQILAGAQQAELTRQLDAAARRITPAGAETSLVRTHLITLALAAGVDVSYLTEPEVVELAATGPEIITPTGDNVTAIGDSVLLAATPQLVERLPGLWIDGAVSRQFFHAAPIVQELKEAGELRYYVIVALATNGTITTDWVDQLLETIGPDHQVLLVNGYGNRPWIPEAAAQLADAAARFPDKVHLVDWNAAASADPSILGGDGIHPNQAGMEKYAQLIIEALNSLASPQ